MDKRTVRAGLVGAGFAASFHFEAIRRVYGARVEVVGVCGRTPQRAGEFARGRGIRVFDTLEQLLGEVDVVHVCTPPVTHEQITVAALASDTFAIVEKPLTGYFGDGSEGFNGERADKAVALDCAIASVQRIVDAEAASAARVLYAENWVYAPAIQKEREIIAKTGAQVLWMHGEEAHSGSHSPAYGHWKFSGGGSLMGKGCHPLTAALHLKAVEGRTRNGTPILPKAVSARTHAITRSDRFQDKGHIRCDYFDIEDFCLVHVVFADDTVADVFASEIILGGIHNWLEIAANNHRSVCNITPNTAMQTFNPRGEYFSDVHLVEKLETKEGWSSPSPDEDFLSGYPQEIEAFYRAIARGDRPESDLQLAANAISTIYSAYVSADRGGAEVGVKVF